MSLISAAYLLFLAVTLIVYYVVPKSWQWVILLIASIVFYAFSSKGLIIFLIFGNIVTFLFAGYFEKKKSRLMMVFMLFIVFGLLIVLKYAGWFTVVSESYVVPLGISYFSLTAASYVIDVYRGTIPSEKNFFKYFLFTMFFPSITQGPLNRYGELMPQLLKKHSLSYRNLTFGSQRILWGFFKKLVIAERLGTIVSTTTEGWGKSGYGGFYVLVTLICYFVQLYMDFSGCADIVIGTAELFGIALPENFNYPFESKSIGEFFRRWHMSLGNWLKDYVMFAFVTGAPSKKLSKILKSRLGKKTAATIISCIGIFLVWLVNAAWHNINLNALALGIFFGGLIILSEALQVPVKAFHKKCAWTSSAGYAFFRIVRTVLLSAFGAFFVAMPGLKEGFAYEGLLFKAPTAAFSTGGVWPRILGLDLLDFIVLLAALGIWILTALLNKKKAARDILSDMHLIPRWAILLALVVVIMLAGFYGGSLDSASFIYQGF